MYGYPVSNGYMGRLRDGTWMLFETEEEYKDYLKEGDDKKWE